MRAADGNARTGDEGSTDSVHRNDGPRLLSRPTHFLRADDLASDAAFEEIFFSSDQCCGGWQCALSDDVQCTVRCKCQGISFRTHRIQGSKGESAMRKAVVALVLAAVACKSPEQKAAEDAAK